MFEVLVDEPFHLNGDGGRRSDPVHDGVAVKNGTVLLGLGIEGHPSRQLDFLQVDRDCNDTNVEV